MRLACGYLRGLKAGGAQGGRAGESGSRLRGSCSERGNVNNQRAEGAVPRRVLSEREEPR